MKNNLNRVLMVFFSILFVFCTSCKNNTDGEKRTNHEDEVVLQDADYISKDQLEWYNFWEDIESANIREKQKFYSAILNASNGVFNRYAMEPFEVTNMFASFGAREYLGYDYPQTRLLDYKIDYSEDRTYVVKVVNEEEYLKKISEIDGIIEELVDEVNQEPSLINKYRLINDWIVQRIKYDFKYADIATKSEIWTEEEEDYMFNTNSDNIYGAIVEKYAVCSGISEAFKYICSKCDLPCIVISGHAGGDEGGAHAWNVVPLYGKYFLIDCTWELIDKTEEEMTILDYYHTRRYFLLENLEATERTMWNSKISEFLLSKEESIKWEYDGTTAVAENGLEITIPSDYEFQGAADSYIVFGLNSEGYRKLFADEEYDEIMFNTNGQIERAIYLVDGQINSIKDFVGTKYLYSEDLRYTVILMIRYEGGLYNIKFVQSGM